MKVKIIGAGSIGNHLAQACRRIGWEVTVVDKDQAAIERMKNEIYPKRYGSWDENIKLFTLDKQPTGGFDIIIIGTPPDSHINLALSALEESPRLLHIEKPLCTPFLEKIDEIEAVLLKKTDILVTVGYDHTVAKSVWRAVELVKQGIIGQIITLDVEFREHWGGIFAAHPWLAGPHDSYLGFWQRGGGAGGEHSHALHLWHYLAKTSGWQKVKQTQASFDFKKDSQGSFYDQIAAFNLTTEDNHFGRVIQDVVTKPTRKWFRLQGKNGFIEWSCNGAPDGGDLLRYSKDDKIIEEVFSKKRLDDFYQVVLHYQNLLDGKIKLADSPMSYQSGLEVMKILNQSYPIKSQKND